MSMYPHACPVCTAAAYIGGDQSIRCTNEDCTHADPDLNLGQLAGDFEEWVEKAAAGEVDWDEDTLPQFDFADLNIKWPV